MFGSKGPGGGDVYARRRLLAVLAVWSCSPCSSLAPARPSLARTKRQGRVKARSQAPPGRAAGAGAEDDAGDAGTGKADTGKADTGKHAEKSDTQDKQSTQEGTSDRGAPFVEDKPGAGDRSGEAGEEAAPDLGVMVANLAVIDGSEEFASSEDQGAAESAPESSETGSEQPISEKGSIRPGRLLPRQRNNLRPNRKRNDLRPNRRPLQPAGPSRKQLPPPLSPLRPCSASRSAIGPTSVSQQPWPKRPRLKRWAPRKPRSNPSPPSQRSPSQPLPSQPLPHVCASTGRSRTGCAPAPAARTVRLQHRRCSRTGRARSPGRPVAADPTFAPARQRCPERRSDHASSKGEPAGRAAPGRGGTTQNTRTRRLR